MSSKKSFIIAITVGLVAIGVLSYFVFMPKRNVASPPETAQPVTGADLGTASGPVVAEPTSSEWKTYRMGDVEFKSNVIHFFTEVSSSAGWVENNPRNQ
jgi:hypothetical protein